MFEERQKQIDRQILLEKAGLTQSEPWARDGLALQLIDALGHDARIARWSLNLVHIVLVGALMVGVYDPALVDHALKSASAATGLQLPAFDWQVTFWTVTALTGFSWGHAVLIKQRTLLVREGRL